MFVSKWVRKELLRVVNVEKKDFSQIGFNHKHLAELVYLLENEDITSEIGRTILEKLAKKDFSPKAYVKKESLGIIKRSDKLETLCRQAIKERASAVEDYKNGKEIALNSIVGWVMKETKGTAKPQEVKEILVRLLK